MTQLVLRAGSVEGADVSSLTLTASGTGNDSAEIAAVHLLRDNNADGAYDAGDTLLASGVYSADDGTVVFGGLTLTVPAASQVTLLVIQDISAGAAQGTFRTGVAQATDVTTTGAVSSVPLTVNGTPAHGNAVTVEPVPVVVTPTYSTFVGACGGPALVGWPLLPLLPFGIFLVYLSRRFRRKDD
jgi:hypothetical protein